ncbi:MAG: SDR family oxidoreductase [Burkholderiales bacterium]|nr:SDR family oxidoreductase [Burkholderiales bacterium]
MQPTLTGKRVLVTGASRGIGRALAVGLTAAGADVAIAARDVAGLQETALQAGRPLPTAAMDLLDLQSVRDAIDGLATKLGGLDVLVNNAGVENVCPALDVSEAIWDRIVDTNLKGQFFSAQAAARIMAGTGGSIINNCSIASAFGIPTAVPYVSSKHGLLGMTRGLATEWAPLGIRVNAIGPGYFRTAMTDVFYENPEWQKAMLPKIPAGRFGELEDLVGAVAFLASDASCYVTGQILYVDGGFSSAL